LSLQQDCTKAHIAFFGVHIAASGVKVAKLEVYKNLNEQNQTPNNGLAILI
jgi:hypothetical protein